MRAAGAVASPGLATRAASAPGHGPPILRHASRSTRLQRLRNTALPSFLPATKSTRPPGRSRDSGVGRLSTRTSLLVPRRPSLKRRSISAVALIVCIIVPRPIGPERQLRSARRKDVTALATTSRDDCPAASGSHACAETMRLRTLPVVRLVCTLHKILRSGR